MYSPGYPCPAELARTVLTAAAVPSLAVADAGSWDLARHALDDDGSILVPAPGPTLAGMLGASGMPLPATLRAARLGPVPVPDRVLTTVVVHGSVAPVTDPAEVDRAWCVINLADPRGCAAAVLLDDGEQHLLRVTADQVWLGGRPVDPPAYRAARPDPFATASDDWADHLLSAHRAEFALLCRLIDPALTARARLLAPVGVDRFGLTVWIGTDSGATTVRLQFRMALREPGELPAAVQELLCRARQRCRRPGG